MEMEREVDGNGAALMARTEIDTSAPFRSVKEAVILFGDKVLACEIANKLNEMRVTTNRNEQTALPFDSLAAELEDARQKLEEAQEERLEMANYLTSLIQELEKTKIELKQLKSKEREKPAINSEIEDIKFVENTTKIEIQRPSINVDVAVQRKKYVNFASQPLLARAMSNDEQVLDRQFSIDRESSQMRNKQKSRTVLPKIVSLFSKKKRYQGEASFHAHAPEREA